MPRVRDILVALELIAPARFAFDFDRVGLQVGDPEATVQRAVVSLDRSLAAIEYASAIGAQLLVAHHPLLFYPLATVTESTYESRAARRLIQEDLNFIAAHTNWDCARGGVNDALAHLLGLQSVEDFGSGAMVATPAGPVLQQAAGRIGTLPEAITGLEFAGLLKDRLGLVPLMFCPADRVIKRVAVVGGAADGEWRAAHAAKMDILVTGEVKQHIGLEAMESGFAIAAAGHYATEQPGVVWLRDRLAESLPEIEWKTFEPDIGTAGRPWSLG